MTEANACFVVLNCPGSCLNQQAHGEVDKVIETYLNAATDQMQLTLHVPYCFSLLRYAGYLACLLVKLKKEKTHAERCHQTYRTMMRTENPYTAGWRTCVLAHEILTTFMIFYSSGFSSTQKLFIPPPSRTLILANFCSSIGAGSSLHTQR